MPKNLKIKTTFTADDKMSRPLTRVQKNLKRMGAITKRVSAGFKRLGRAMLAVGRLGAKALKVGFVAIAGGATAGFLAIEKMAGSMDTLAKTARSIDFPIEDFQEWRFVAEQSGVEQGQFDKSMQKFTKTVGEAKSGYGALFTALNKNNKPLLEQLKNTDNVSDALAIYMKAINESGGATEKAALSAAGFGRSGIDMINIANLSSKEIATLRKEMQENGVVTAEQAEQAEKYNDMMNRLKLTIMGFLRGVLVPLMPKLTELADKLREWILNNKELINQKVNEYFTKIKDTAIDLYNWIVTNKQSFYDLWETMKTVVTTGLEVIKFFVQNKEAVIGLIGVYMTLKGLQMANSLKNMAIASASVGASSAGAVPGISAMAGALKKASLIVGGLILMYETLTWAVNQYWKAKNAETERSNASTDRQRALAGTDLSKLSDNALKTNYNLQKERMADLEGQKAGENFIFGGLSTEEEAELEGMQGNFRDMQRELVRRKTGGSVEKQEVTIKDETGRAEVTKGGKSGSLKLINSGGMV